MGMGEQCYSFTYLQNVQSSVWARGASVVEVLNPSSLMLTVPRPIPIQHFLPGCYLRSCTGIQHQSWTQKQEWASGCTSVAAYLSWLSLSTQTGISFLRRAPSHALLSIQESNFQVVLNLALSCFCTCALLWRLVLSYLRLAIKELFDWQFCWVDSDVSSHI